MESPSSTLVSVNLIGMTFWPSSFFFPLFLQLTQMPAVVGGSNFQGPLSEIEIVVSSWVIAGNTLYLKSSPASWSLLKYPVHSKYLSLIF